MLESFPGHTMRCPQVISWWNTADTGHLLARHRNHRAVNIFAYWLIPVGSASSTHNVSCCDEASIHLPNLVGEEGDVTRCEAVRLWVWNCCHTFSEDVAAVVLCTFPAAGTHTSGRGKICECWEIPCSTNIYIMLLFCFNMRANRRRRRQSSFSRNARRMILMLRAQHLIRALWSLWSCMAGSCTLHKLYQVVLLLRSTCRSSVSLYHCINLQQFDLYYDMILINSLHKDTHTHMCVCTFL